MQKIRKSGPKKNRKSARRWHVLSQDEAKTLGQRLRYFRESKGWGQGDVAERVGISIPQISRHENDQGRPQGDHLQKLAELYGVNVEYLTVGEKSQTTTGLVEGGGKQKVPYLLAQRFTNREILVFPNRNEAYGHLSQLICERPRTKIDLLQFSGQTALPILRAIATSCPEAEVRLLLYDPKLAQNLDSDHQPDHRARIIATMDAIPLMDTAGASDFAVTIYYYKMAASVSSVIVDDSIVSLSWYYSFFDPSMKKIIRQRGHDSATIIDISKPPSSLGQFARRHFDLILKTAALAPTRRKKNARHQ